MNNFEIKNLIVTLTLKKGKLLSAVGGLNKLTQLIT